MRRSRFYLPQLGVKIIMASLVFLSVILQSNAQLKNSSAPMFQKGFSLPLFSMKMVVLDDDLEMQVFQRHVEATTQTYLNQSFTNVEKLFGLTPQHSFLENLQLSTNRITRTFVGLQQERHRDTSAPVSFVVSVMEGSITYVNGQHSAPPDSTIHEVESIILSILQFALQDSIHFLMAAFHENPILRLIAETQVVFDTVEQELMDESTQSDREYGIILVEDSTSSKVNESSPTRYEFSTPVIVATLAAFLMTLSLFCCLAGIWRMVFPTSRNDTSSTGWSLKGDKLTRHRAWIQRGCLTKDESQKDFSIESQSILYLSAEDTGPSLQEHDLRQRILRFMRHKQRKDVGSHVDTSSLPSVVVIHSQPHMTSTK